MRLSLRPRRVSSALRAALIMHALPRDLLVLGGSSGPCVPHCVRRCWPRRGVCSYFVLRNGLRLLTLRASQRFASDYSHFVPRSASRVVVVAVSVRLLVLRASQRFASPPTSQSVHPVGGDPGSSDAPAARSNSRCAVHALRARCVARDAIDGGARFTTAWTDSSRICSLRVTLRALRGAHAVRSRSVAPAQPLTKRGARVVPAGSDDLTRNAESTTPEGEAEGTPGSIHGRGHTTGRTTIPRGEAASCSQRVQGGDSS